MLHRPHIAAFGSALIIVIAFAAIGGEAPATASGPVLYGVTGEGGAQPESLFIIDHRTAEVTLLSPLGNGNDGEEIAYDANKGLILHASGRAEKMILEWLDPSTRAVTPLPHSGDDCDEVSALTQLGDGTFIAGTIDWLLCSITSDGVIKEVARVEMVEIPTGLAWVNGRLYATEWGENTDLYRLDPATGEITGIVDIEMMGTDYRLTALTGHPCTHQLYAVMTIGSTEIRQPTSRSLVTINPASGRVKVIGDLGENFAGIAFVGDQCEERRAPRVPSPSTTPSPSATSTPGALDLIRPPSTGDAGLLH